MRHSQVDENDALHDLLPRWTRGKFLTLKDIKYLMLDVPLNSIIFTQQRKNKRKEIDGKHSLFTVFKLFSALDLIQGYNC